MKTIKFILNDDGSILESSIGFQINQYSYNDTLINVYVPSHIVSETETYNEVVDEHVTKYYTTGTNIAMCMSYALRNGSRDWSKTYYFTYVKNNVVINNKTYTLFERRMPREFTLYAGNQLYAINVIQYQTILTRDTTNNPATETTETTTLGIVSTATYQLNINASINMAENPQETTTDLSTLIADVNALMIAIVGKQDKQDASILVNIANGNPQTTDYVVNALNCLNQRVKENFNTNDSQASYISDLNDRVSDLERGITTEFRYIGTYVSNDDPNESDLTDYVEGLGYTLQNGDVVIWIKELTTTDKNYRCLYNEVGGWSWYEIPPIERANNDGYGSIKGTYWDNDMSYLKVDIDEGLIQDIYIKRSGNWVSLYSEINNLLDFKDDLISGSQAVNKAIYAQYDESERNSLNPLSINSKYMTNLNGASKQFVQNYALPRQFNDVNSLHFTATGDVFGPSTYTEIASSKATSLVLGDNTILDAKLWVSFNATSFSYQLSNKNSFKAVFNIAFASSITDVGFTLNITYVAEDNTQTLVASVPTDRFNYDANTHKLTISDYFNRLDEIGITISAGHYDIELICNTTSSGNTITIYSGAGANVYSTISLSTDSYTLMTSQSGIIIHSIRGVYDSTYNIIKFELGNIALVDKTQHLFELILPIGMNWDTIPANCCYQLYLNGTDIGLILNTDPNYQFMGLLYKFRDGGEKFVFEATCVDNNGTFEFIVADTNATIPYLPRQNDITYDSVNDKYIVSDELAYLMSKYDTQLKLSIWVNNWTYPTIIARLKTYDDTNEIYYYDTFDMSSDKLNIVKLKVFYNSPSTQYELVAEHIDKLNADSIGDTNSTNKFVTYAQKIKIDNAYGPAYVGKDTSTNILAKTSNQGVWVGSDTGHWYYWNGTQYVDGGVYQTDLSYDSIRSELTDFEKQTNKSIGFYDNVELGYWNNSGNIATDVNTYTHTKKFKMTYIPTTYVNFHSVATWLNGVFNGLTLKSNIELLGDFDEIAYNFSTSVAPVGTTIYFDKAQTIDKDIEDIALNFGYYPEIFNGYYFNLSDGAKQPFPNSYSCFKIGATKYVNFSLSNLHSIVLYKDNAFVVSYLTANIPSTITVDFNSIGYNITGVSTHTGDIEYIPDTLLYNKIQQGGTGELNQWYGKTINFLGDSITAGYWFDSNNESHQATKRYCEVACELLGATCVNYGMSGTSISGTSETLSAYSFTNRYTNMGSADAVFILGGTNDYATNVVLGTEADTTDISFYGALDVLCRGLIEKYLGKPIIFISPLPRLIQTANTAGYTFAQYREAIVKVCHDRYGLKVIDGFDLGVSVKDATFKATYIQDGLHPNDDLHEIIGKNLGHIMKAI